MIRSDNIDLVAAALVKAQSEMGNASKGSANPFFKSRYADLNSIREACLPELAANGLSVLQPMVVIDGKNYIETLILHTSGQFLGGHTEVVFSKANDAQNFGAGTTYARRFGLQSFLCIGAEDDDGEKAVGRNTQSKPATSPVVVKTNLENGKEVNVLSNGQAEVVAPPKKGFGVKAPAAPIEKATTDEWS